MHRRHSQESHKTGCAGSDAAPSGGVLAGAPVSRAERGNSEPPAAPEGLEVAVGAIFGLPCFLTGKATTTRRVELVAVPAKLQGLRSLLDQEQGLRALLTGSHTPPNSKAAERDLHRSVIERLTRFDSLRATGTEPDAALFTAYGILRLWDLKSRHGNAGQSASVRLPWRAAARAAGRSPSVSDGRSPGAGTQSSPDTSRAADWSPPTTFAGGVHLAFPQTSGSWILPSPLAASLAMRTNNEADQEGRKP